MYLAQISGAGAALARTKMHPVQAVGALHHYMLPLCRLPNIVALRSFVWGELTKFGSCPLELALMTHRLCRHILLTPFIGVNISVFKPLFGEVPRS